MNGSVCKDIYIVIIKIIDRRERKEKKKNENEKESKK